MKVFISWSGDQSKPIAAALRVIIPRVLPSVKPFMSQSDLGAGERWAQRLNEELAETYFGIIVLTPTNKDKRWILFEAGALSKSLTKSRVACYVVGMSLSDVESPLGSFQNVIADFDGTLEILKSIVEEMGENIPEEELRKRLGPWWPEVEASLKTPGEAAPPATPAPTRSPEEMHGEILVEIRSLSRQLAGMTSGLTIPKPRQIRVPGTIASPPVAVEGLQILTVDRARELALRALAEDRNLDFTERMILVGASTIHAAGVSNGELVIANVAAIDRLDMGSQFPRYQDIREFIRSQGYKTARFIRVFVGTAASMYVLNVNRRMDDPVGVVTFQTAAFDEAELLQRFPDQVEDSGNSGADAS